MPVINKNIRWALLVLHIVFAVAVQVYLLAYAAMLPWDYVLKDMTVNTLLLSFGIWLLYIIVKAYPTPVAIMMYSLLAATLFSIIIALTDFHVLKNWLLASDDPNKAWLLHTLPLRLLLTWLIFGWASTYIALRKKNAAIEEDYQLQKDATVLLRDAELFKLRQQLQPHFLYNSLNSISALIMIQPDKAQEMIGKLSDFLRSSVKRESENETPIEDELLYIEAYLAIESIRFGDRLQVVYEKEYTDDATVPPFLLQPVLENAIKFGLYSNTGKVTIKIHIALHDAMLTIKVNNPYDPHTTPPKGTGFGLEGINRRLYLLYGRSDLLETEKDSSTFSTILKIPQTHVQSNIDR